MLLVKEKGKIHNHIFAPKTGINNILEIVYDLSSELGIPKELIDYIIHTGNIPKSIEFERIVNKYKFTLMVIRNLLTGKGRNEELYFMNLFFSSKDDGNCLEDENYELIGKYLTDGRNHVRDINRDFPDLYALARLMRYIERMIFIPHYLYTLDIEKRKIYAEDNYYAYGMLEEVSRYVYYYYPPVSTISDKARNYIQA